MPFYGMLSEKADEILHKLDSREILISWLPSWWLSLAISFTTAGIGIGCSIWSVVNQINELSVATPFLIGCSAVVASFGGIVVPVVLAFFKDRSESREVVHTKARVQELENQLKITQKGYRDNVADIQRIQDDAENIIRAEKASNEVYDSSIKKGEKI